MDRRRQSRQLAALLSIVVLTCVATAHAAAAPVLDLDPHAQSQTLAGYVAAHLDVDASRQLKELLSDNDAWSFVGQRHYGKPLTEGDVWVRVRLRNPTSMPIARHVALTFALIDRVTIYVLAGDQLLTRHEAGEDTEPDDRVVGSMQPQVPLVVPPGETRTVVFHLRDEGSIPVPLQVATPSHLQGEAKVTTLVAGIFLGIYLISALFAGFLASRLRERLYAWLALYLVSMSMLVAVFLGGDAGYALPAPVRCWWTNRTIMWGASVACAAFIAFMIDLLELRQTMPRTTRLLQGVIIVLSLIFLAFFVGTFLDIIRVYNAVAGVGLFAASAAVATRARAGDRIAREFSVGILAMSVGGVVMGARTQGWLPINFFTENTFLIGALVLLASMGVAVANRFAAIQRARRDALRAQLEQARRNAELSTVFERFVPKEFLERLGRYDIADIALGDSVQKEMTVLFSDIRGFTTLVETMTPSENFAFVNEFLGYMEPAIHGERGFIDKYIGDAVMALFDDDTRRDGNYTPETTGRAGAEHAISAAVAMHRALRAYNEQRVGRDEPPVQIGVGLHTGELMLGTLGGQDRLNASVIGDAVNLAARVEGLTKRYGTPLLITEHTQGALPAEHGFALRPVDRVRVKGKSEPVTLWEVLQANADATCAARRATLDTYLAGWDAFVANDHAAAAVHFRAVLEATPDLIDTAAKLLATRCDAFAKNGVPDSWDGAATLTSK